MYVYIYILYVMLFTCCLDHWSSKYGFEDAAFLPSKVSFHTTFLKDCDKGYGIWAATCIYKFS